MQTVGFFTLHKEDLHLEKVKCNERKVFLLCGSCEAIMSIILLITYQMIVLSLMIYQHSALRRQMFVFVKKIFGVFLAALVQKLSGRLEMLL